MCQDGIFAAGEADDEAGGAPSAVAALRAVTAAGSGETDFLSAIRPTDLVASRAAASRITERGARLHDLLRRETEGGAREARLAAVRFLDGLSGSLMVGGGGKDLESFEQSIRDAIARSREDAVGMEREAADLVEDERGLSGKIKKKRAELERAQRRLMSLKSVRPAFADEYERMERELSGEYDKYVTRYRNLDFLHRTLEEASTRERQEAETHNEQLRRLQKKLREEEASLVRGDEAGAGAGAGEAATQSPMPAAYTAPKVGAATALPYSSLPATAAPKAAAAAVAAAPIPPRGPTVTKGRMDADDSDDDLGNEDEDEDEDEGGGDENDSLDGDF